MSADTIHLPSYLFFVGWEMGYKEDLILIICSFVLFVFCTNVYVTYSNNNNNKIQVHKTFDSDENFIVDFAGRWFGLVFAYLLIKLKKNPP